MKNLETPGKTGRVGRYAYGHFDVNKTMIVFSVINYKLTYVVTKKNPLLLGVCSCCYVLFCHLIMCLSHAVHGFLTNQRCWSFHFIRRALLGHFSHFFLLNDFSPLDLGAWNRLPLPRT